MNNEKLNLMELKVKSFITAISKTDSWTVRAGTNITCHPTNCLNGGTITGTGNGTGTGGTNTGNNTTGNNTTGNTTTSGDDTTDDGGPLPEGG